MIDLSTIPDAVKIARGEYSIVRSAHEDSKKELQERCSEMMALIPQILKYGQGDEDKALDLLAELRRGMWKVKPLLKRMQLLSAQKQELRLKAWGKSE